MKGSRITRVLTYFREADVDEVRVCHQLVREIVEARLGTAKGTVGSVVKKRRKRKVNSVAEVADGQQPTQ